MDSRKNSTCRSCKGSSLLESYDTYVAIDIETTGFSPSADAIIEIGAVLVDNGLVVDSFGTLVNPRRSIPSGVSQLTGITDDMVASAPSIDIAIKGFVDFIGNYPLVGHSGLQDGPFTALPITSLVHC